MKRRSLGFDGVADEYDRTRRVPRDAMDRVEAAMADALGSADPVLEVGVGTGRIALPLRRRGFRVVGIDVAPKMLRRGVRKGLEDVVLADALDLPFGDLSFQGSVAVHVLHLVPEWRRAVAEAARVTRDVFVTFLRRSVSGPTLHSRYRDLLGPLGDGRDPSWSAPDELAEEVPPIRDEALPEYEMHRPAAELLRELQAKLYSFQWGVPEDVHRGIMDRLWRQFDGRYVTTVFEGRVRVWRAADLRDAYSDAFRPQS